MAEKAKTTLTPENMPSLYRLLKPLKGKKFAARYPSEVLGDDRVFPWVNYNPNFKKHCLNVLKIGSHLMPFSELKFCSGKHEGDLKSSRRTNAAWQLLIKDWQIGEEYILSLSSSAKQVFFPPYPKVYEERLVAKKARPCSPFIRRQEATESCRPS